jgi:hypothetical protein
MMALTLYTMNEAAGELRIKKATLRNRVRTINVPTLKIGNTELITGDELNKLRPIGNPQKGSPLKKRV